MKQTSDDYLDLKVGLLDPSDGLAEFRVGALVCEVAGVDEDVALGEPEGAVWGGVVRV